MNHPKIYRKGVRGKALFVKRVSPGRRRLFLFSLLASALLLLLASCAGAARSARPSDPELDRMAGQMLMVGFRGLTAWPDSPIARQISGLGLGGVVLFDRDAALGSDMRNVKDQAQVLALTGQLKSYSKIPLLVAVDQEGGKVARLGPRHGFPRTWPALFLGCGADTDVTRLATEQMARTVARSGCNLNLAPVVDVAVNLDNPVIHGLGRAFSSDPREVASHAAAFVDAMRAHGVLTCLKHFPGHGSSAQDSHKGVADVTRTWTEDELIPYRELMAQGRADMVMTGHLFNARLDPEHPATLSRATIQGLLRDKLGYDGVVVTDDLQMGAIAARYTLEQTVRLAVQAGADILLFGNNLSWDPDVAAKARAVLVGLVRDGTVPRSRIEQSYRRIMELKKRLP